jgi:hypothetical protein
MSSTLTIPRPASPTPVRPAAAARPVEKSTLARLATSGIAWGFLVSAVAVAWTLLGFGGRQYYFSPLATRAYDPAHPMLRPSGPIGQSFGVLGTALMLVPFAYMVRKRLRRSGATKTLNTWLEIHLFCGVVGPVLVTLHTSFKFNGIISAAYWSMVIVMLSGFVGRYLYVRIPRSIRGNEMTRTEVETEAEAIKDEIAQSSSERALARIEAFDRDVLPHRSQDLSSLDLFFGEAIVGRKLRALDAALAEEGVSEHVRKGLIRLTAERAMLVRRGAHLQRTKQLFSLWHVFHLPLVYLLLVIAAAHIGVALYLGYVPFRW